MKLCRTNKTALTDLISNLLLPFVYLFALHLWKHSFSVRGVTTCDGMAKKPCG